MRRRYSINLTRLVLLLLSSILFGADATGRWTGTLTMIGRDGEAHPGTVILVLNQKETALTGTAGPNESDQKTIQHGKVEDGIITFTIEPHEGMVMRFTLKQAGDEISGDIRGEREGEVVSAKLVVKREK